MSATLSTGLIIAVAVAVLGMMVWSVQRIITRIDTLVEGLYDLRDRVSVIETKQNDTTVVTRATARKVGVRRLPPEPEAANS